MESPLNLNGKIALITGSTRGIGWSCAKALAENGATVLLNGISDKGLLDDRVNKIKSDYKTGAQGFLFDVGDAEQVKDCYSRIFKEYKGLDILVNNAGVIHDSLIGMITQADINDILNINVQGVILNTQYASRLMTRRKKGSIINVSSIVGRFGNAGQTVYAGSKAAVIGITLSTAKELAPMNIRVNAIAPGFIDTDMIRHLSREKYQERMQSIKMGRIGEPEDVANAVTYFASDLSSYITGQVLGVDGGMLI